MALPSWLLLGLVALAPAATAQITEQEEQLLQKLGDAPIKETAEQVKLRAPFEVFRTQVAPFDVLPYVKPSHWSTLSVELRANHDDYDGLVQTAEIPLLGLPTAMVYRRDARLVREARSRVSFQAFLPIVPKELSLALVRPDSVRPDEQWLSPMKVLEPHQMVIVVMSRETTDGYARWNQFRALQPLYLEDPTNATAVEAARYYRLVLPLEAGKPLVSPHPGSWSTISHILWDNMAPEALSPAQQQAMLDWLHWGGQLILLGGSGPSFGSLRDSFLQPYLPGESSGESALLNAADLKPLSEAYQPLNRPSDLDDPQPQPLSPQEAIERMGSQYREPVPILPASNRPIFLDLIKPRPGATPIALDASTGRIIGAEHRVGRGRVLMLGLHPTDPAMIAWPGLDTFVRRVILRRPDEIKIDHQPRFTPSGELLAPRYRHLAGGDLSWYRILARDASAPTEIRAELFPQSKRISSPGESAPGNVPIVPPQSDGSFLSRLSPTWAQGMSATERPTTEPPVASWIDANDFPRLCRSSLETASGISIPSSRFVLKIVVSYILAVIPLNWLLCRFVLKRKEWAWLFVPILALGFAVGVERAAAYDLGYDLACDEINLIEVQPGYTRAHLTRIGSLSTSGRVRFSMSFPNDPLALALPFDHGRSLRGEEVTESIWQSSPVPLLGEIRVQPRTLSMFRAEQYVDLGGSIRIVADGKGRRIDNGSGLELKDARVLEKTEAGSRSFPVGTLAPGASAVLPEAGEEGDTPAKFDGPLDPNPYLRLLGHSIGERPEERGEVRLVAWLPGHQPGSRLDPEVDRHRGLTMVVVHLAYPAVPGPDGPRFDGRMISTIAEPPAEQEPEPRIQDHVAEPDPNSKIVP
ncbi:hypothetical protein EP7_004044 [Isosphaeraceae bacterium EP7]